MMAVEDYLNSAIDSLDRNFGKGYAQKHPELVGAYINACVREQFTPYVANALGDIADSIRALKEVE
jgi:DNA-binding phage protein